MARLRRDRPRGVQGGGSQGQWQARQVHGETLPDVGAGFGIYNKWGLCQYPVMVTGTLQSIWRSRRRRRTGTTNTSPTTARCSSVSDQVINYQSWSRWHMQARGPQSLTGTKLQVWYEMFKLRICWRTCLNNGGQQLQGPTMSSLPDGLQGTPEVSLLRSF